MRKATAIFTFVLASSLSFPLYAQDALNSEDAFMGEVPAGVVLVDSQEPPKGSTDFNWGSSTATSVDATNNDDSSANVASHVDSEIDITSKASVSATSNELNESLVDEEASVSDRILGYIDDRFSFGSYGRVQPSINPSNGRSGRQARIVYPSPRVDEGSYLELHLGYLPFKFDNGTTVGIHTTLALEGDKLFHFDGDWDASIALRNLYVEVRNLWFDGFTVWAGSRMYRGDDIYLLDMWPLDNLNTYGGGLGYDDGKTRVFFHMGTNRLKNDYQYQVVEVVDERFFGKRDVVYLDRQRLIASLKGEHNWGGQAIGDSDAHSPMFKAKLYGEFHSLASGEYLQKQPESVVSLPSDKGWLIGAQFGVYDFDDKGVMDDSHVQVFLKYGAGLAAYGEMVIPFGLGSDLRASNAKQILAGLSSELNFSRYFGMKLGGYIRYFLDADGISEDFDDGLEGVWDIRLTGHIVEHFDFSLEFSQQLRRPNGLSPLSLKQDMASLFKFSVLPSLSFGRGTSAYTEIRVNYTLSALNDAAQELFPTRDKLRTAKYEHFLGIAAEWWFNVP